ncbi:MAG: 23S rRNA (guanosine(2251)-2'-O)-methyltransferase RlmB [Rhodospirillales bacterium]|nr:23S rRNA (guanosine(2251)-2'-O)-methyltransferase RlmB [Rhodospirillales bacterium]MCB9964769.1 23S rRNA (guanosine(2251)-2'-O)-methyltransferase RlmB [Rhodospirillales bacterium]MCB9973813.1 23S rRNA (guanosine(2251)-2'-O)-methyltransferase RlmB [Rhodospirillales bacterium]MCB9980651.1 23S rRNA (guanosine(2251)-2'-O)-methyltransferase RlmB [Rhodospirillales bacterium]
MSKLTANIWGAHAVRAAWLNPAREISHIFVTEQAVREFSSFQAMKGEKRPSPTLVSKKDLDKMTDHAVHQGMALVTAPLPEVFLGDLLVATSAQNRSVILMLDQVTDPHNVGAILRSACAFGAAGLILQKKHAPTLDGVLAKTACGAMEHVPVLSETNLSRTIEQLQDAGWTVIGLDERGSRTIGQFDLPEKLVLVLGAEGPGLRQNVAHHCDFLAKLEMKGPMPSINVSNAAAVALYAATI